MKDNNNLKTRLKETIHNTGIIKKLKHSSLRLLNILVLLPQTT